MPLTKTQKARLISALRQVNYRGYRSKMRFANRKRNGFYRYNRKPWIYPLRARRGNGAYGKKELKWFDTSNAGNVSSLGSDVVLASTLNMSAGVSGEQRIGRHITLESMYVDAVLTLAKSQGTNNETPNAYQGVDKSVGWCRFIVYLDMQHNGAMVAPSIDDILQDYNTPPAQNISAYNNLNNSDRFRILLNKRIKLRAQSGGLGVREVGTPDPTSFQVAGFSAPDVYRKRFKIPGVKGLRIEYAGNTTGLAEIKSNNIGIYVLGASAPIGWDFSVRTRFYG